MGSYGQAPSAPQTVEPSLQRVLIDRIHKCLTSYSVKLEGPVILGLSGGKDSLSLLFLLSEMDIEVHPIIIDLGYAGFQAEEIAASVLTHGFRAQIVVAKRLESLVHLPSRSRAKVEGHLDFLSNPSNNTPCSACSQVKRTLLLAEARRRNADWVVFGHHREDLLATILKDYFVYLYYQKSGSYNYVEFFNFVQECKIDIDLLDKLIDRRVAATMGIRLPLGEEVDLFRPMAFVLESETERFVREIGVMPFGSGCAHESFQNGQLATKREIVHKRLRGLLAETPTLGERLLTTSLRSLDARGRALFNPRALRNEILPGFDEIRTVAWK